MMSFSSEDTPLGVRVRRTHILSYVRSWRSFCASAEVTPLMPFRSISLKIESLAPRPSSTPPPHSAATRSPRFPVAGNGFANPGNSPLGHTYIYGNESFGECVILSLSLSAHLGRQMLGQIIICPYNGLFWWWTYGNWCVAMNKGKAFMPLLPHT